jgi:hypothetical protein
MPIIIDNKNLKAYNYETLAPAASTGFTASIIAPSDAGYLASTQTSGKGKCQAVLVTVTGQPIRFTLNGTTPTAAIGNVLAVNDSLWLKTYDSIEDFRCIETAATASVQVTFFR